MKQSILLYVCAFISIGLADKIVLNDCGSINGKVLEVRVTGCTEADKQCILKRNTNATIEIDFEAIKDADKLKVVVHGILMDIQTPFPMPNPDACKDSGIECPIKSGHSYSFSTTLPILKAYPKVSVDIKFELKSNEDYVCVMIPAKLN